MNRIKVLISKTSGSVAKTLRKGPTTARAAAPESTTPTSNHRKLVQALPTIPPLSKGSLPSLPSQPVHLLPIRRLCYTVRVGEVIIDVLERYQ
jgi:hypothetical protein